MTTPAAGADIYHRDQYLNGTRSRWRDYQLEHMVRVMNRARAAKLARSAAEWTEVDADTRFVAGGLWPNQSHRQHFARRRRASKQCRIVR